MKTAAHSAEFLKRTRGFHQNYTRINILFYRDSVSISGLKSFSAIHFFNLRKSLLFPTSPQIAVILQEFIRKPEQFTISIFVNFESI